MTLNSLISQLIKIRKERKFDDKTKVELEINKIYETGEITKIVTIASIKSIEVDKKCVIFQGFLKKNKYKPVKTLKEMDREDIKK